MTKQYPKEGHENLSEKIAKQGKGYAPQVIRTRDVKKHIQALEKDLKDELLTKGSSVSKGRIKYIIDKSFEKHIGGKLR